MIKEVKIFTDGASSGNPGPGGYGVVLLYHLPALPTSGQAGQAGKHRKELSAGFRKTTNNRMELMAVIEGLKALKSKCNVTVYSDSKYIVDAIEQGWLERWAAKGWMRNKKDKVLNPDLWKELYQLLKLHVVKFEWVRGHFGNIENERCDVLAVKASQQENLPPDIMYEQNAEKNKSILF